VRAIVRAVATWRFALALSVAVVLWVSLTIAQNPEREDAYPTDIPIEVRGLAPTLVVANEIGSVRVRIVAPEDSWRRLQASSFRATLDTSQLPAGLHQRDIVVECSDPDVRMLTWTPAKVAVRVEENRTITVPVRTNFVGAVPFGYRVVGAPLVSPGTVSVVGPASVVEKVTEAGVTVRMDELKSTVERTIKPEPRGGNGVVGGVRVDPQSVSVTVEVEQIAGSKAVPVVASVKGQTAIGFGLAGVTVEPATVQVVGDPALLEKLSTLTTQDIEVTGATFDVNRTVSVVRPAGVNVVGEAPIAVRVRVAPLPGQQARTVAVVATGLMSGMTATVEPESITVVVSGTQPALLRLAGGDIVSQVDLTALGPGSFVVPVTTSAPEGVRVERLEPDRVAIVIVPSSPTVSPRP
jgi:YbbR domain-containing protein